MQMSNNGIASLYISWAIIQLSSEFRIYANYFIEQDSRKLVCLGSNLGADIDNLCVCFLYNGSLLDEAGLLESAGIGHPVGIKKPARG